MTIRELTQELLNRVLNSHGKLTPGESLEIAEELSALLGAIGSEVAELEFQANNVQLLAMNEPETSVAKAEALKKGSKEYKEYRKAQALLNAVEQTIVTLRRKSSNEYMDHSLTKV